MRSSVCTQVQPTHRLTPKARASYDTAMMLPLLSLKMRASCDVGNAFEKQVTVCQSACRVQVGWVVPYKRFAEPTTGFCGGGCTPVPLNGAVSTVLKPYTQNALTKAVAAVLPPLNGFRP